MTFNHGLGLYDYRSSTFSVIMGSTTHGFLDGAFSQLRFYLPRGLAFLSSNYRLRVLDVTTNTSSSICSGVRGNSDGDVSSCQLNSPWFLFEVNDVVYIGEAQSIRSMSGRYHLKTRQKV